MSDQARVNTGVWRRRPPGRTYGNRVLGPAEVLMLAQYRPDLEGRVLELGCGGGRLTGYLLELSAQVEALDISPAMIGHCRATFPGGAYAVGDLRDLSGQADGAYDAVIAGGNLIDVLEHTERLRFLREAQRIMHARGVLIFSSHNLGAAATIREPTQLSGPPLRIARGMLRMPWRLRNRRRLRPLERVGDDHAILNDEAHDYSLLHYYVTRDTQAAQLRDAGLDLLECRDTDGHLVGPGEQAPSSTELYYAARRGAAG